jgi:UTP--glucose-1-phosphate uridylyltransferase
MAYPKLRKAVFPAAGLGTRFLPATKSIPKEMLCLVDKPLIQYGVEEAVAAGCTEIIIVTGRDKGAMEDHFDSSPELEAALAAKNKQSLLEVVRSVSKLARTVYTRQAEPLGLGHAVLMAKDIVGDEPFCVLLPDDVVDASVPCLKQMVEAFYETQSSILASEVIEGRPSPPMACSTVRRCRRIPGC